MNASGVKPAVLFYCIGGKTTGMGHLFRCRMLMEQLAGPGSMIAVRPDPDAAGFLEDAGIAWRPVDPSLSGGGLGLALADMARQRRARIVLLDCKDNSRELVRAIRQTGLVVADLEDTGPGRLDADLLIDPHIQPASLEAGYTGRADCSYGPTWAMVHPRLAAHHQAIADGEKAAGNQSETLRVLVSLGGSDPSGLSEKVLDLLLRMPHEPVVDLVLGPAAPDITVPRAAGDTVRVHRGLCSLDNLLSEADMAFVSGGITMFESLCLGVPTAVVPQHEEQYVNASRLARRGALVIAPPPQDDGAGVGLEVVVKEIVEDRALRQRIADKGFALVDGRGVERIGLRLEQLLRGPDKDKNAALDAAHEMGKESRIG